jgi:VanZ family protein
MLVLAACLFPYHLEPGSGPTLAGESRKSADDTLRDVVVNILLFLPFGAAMAATTAPRGRRGPGHPALTLMAAAALSLGVEGAQTLLPSRDPSLRDVTANVGGAMLGHLLLSSWEIQISARWRAIEALWRRLGLLDRPGRVLCAYVILALVSAGVLQMSTRLSDWSPEFPLVVGTEATGDRPWTGWIRTLEISDRALSPRQASAAVGTSLERLLPGSLVLSQHFPDGQLPPAATAAGLAWQGPPLPPPPASRPGLFVPGVRWLRSDEAGRLVGGALRRTNQLTLKLVCRPASLAQQGPGRIVSISADPYQRNLTVGEERSALVVRLRTPVTGPNGREPELVRPRVFERDGDRTILVTYDGAVLTAYVDGAEDPSRLELSPGAVLVSSLASPDPRDLPGYTVLFLALVSAPAGVLFGLALPRRVPPGPWALLSIVGFSVLLAGGLELVLVLVSGRALDVGQVVTGVVLGSTAAGCGLRLRP